MYIPKSEVTTYRSAGTATADLATQSLASETAAAVGSGVVSPLSPTSGGGIVNNPIGTTQPSPSQPPSQQPSPPSGGGRGFNPIGPTQPISSPSLPTPPLPSPPSGGGRGFRPIGPTPPIITLPLPTLPLHSPPSGGGRGFRPIGPTPPIITLPIAGAPLPPLRRPPILAPPGGIRSPPGAGRIHCLGPECGPIQWPIPIRPLPPRPPIRSPLPPRPPIWLPPPPIRRPTPQPPHLPPVSPPQPPRPPIRLPPPPLPPLGRYWHPRPRPALRPAQPPAERPMITTPTRGAPVRLTQVAASAAGRPAAVGNVLELFRPLNRTEMANLGAARTVTRTVTRNEAVTARGTTTVQNVQSPTLTQRLNEVYAPTITRTTGSPTTITARRTVGNVGTSAVGNVQGGLTVRGPQGSVYIPAQELLAAAAGG